jgi:hypothetical protein
MWILNISIGLISRFGHIVEGVTCCRSVYCNKNDRSTSSTFIHKSIDKKEQIVVLIFLIWDLQPFVAMNLKN